MSLMSLQNNPSFDNICRGRNSSIELLRIIAMFTIIAHHYAIHSGVLQSVSPHYLKMNTLFLQIFGMWGKTAVNIFVLITGFFMCEKELTFERYLKLISPVMFYGWIASSIKLLIGCESISLGNLVTGFLAPFDILVRQSESFVPAYLWMYLFIPMINVYIRSSTRHNLLCCILILLAMFSGCGTLLNANVFHAVFWYITLYLVGAFVRKYPFVWMCDNRYTIPFLLILICASVFSVFGFDILGYYLGRPTWDPYSFMSDSHKILAFATSLFAFCAFKNLKIPYIRFINTVATTVFGILLIHDTSWGVWRGYLWCDLIKVPVAFSFHIVAFVGYSLASVLLIFITCSVVDYIRIRIIERPLLDLWFRSRHRSCT